MASTEVVNAYLIKNSKGEGEGEKEKKKKKGGGGGGGERERERGGGRKIEREGQRTEKEERWR